VSYEIGIRTVRLEPTPRLAHTEYCDHAPLVREVEARTGKPFNDAWELDFLWGTNDGPVGWGERGRVTDMGHAEYVEHGADRREAKPSPFTDPGQVLEFDAVAEYGLPETDALVDYYQKRYRDSRRAHPNQVTTGGYYKTIVSGAIQSFGWEMLLMAAIDEDGFERVLDSFFRLSMRHFEAWARTSIEVFICHDDFVWTQGPFVNPDFYRRAIFPRYAKLWGVLRKAGKKVLFCSDGDWSCFVDDVAAAGADGFIFEPMMSLDPVVERWGSTHAILASKVDCRTMTFGTADDVRAEIDATLLLATKCPGFMFAVGNHIPANVPVETALAYFEHLRANWARG
jgi:hypothetical protein